MSSPSLDNETRLLKITQGLPSQLKKLDSQHLVEERLNYMAAVSNHAMGTRSL